ncbi:MULTISPECIES: universal stress protein [Maritimibacter]|jgi:nucleotide-binding universal stress UspA family protein|uniref:Universal stress family protein n=1 Tax=Maritimibacter alkaliphilus HTCC2654 TaxID=314271 RepID=A3VAU5_9RHOB|nr:MULTISPECIES: universal stress protein [Maritimibacter]EAQ15036.1 universal stress family protein [Maritimibacter alkaliphilus HTCC2654]MBL6426460.1 universal stress protein [Maritimibacter sp.]TYP80739.1 nucleotide-binding universal stress UspA family protein [Maritimibacter alkaliphilus HTCC2654]
MYKNILVPITFDETRDSKTALEIAHAISEDGAKITALHVVEEIPSYVAQYLPEGQMAHNVQDIEATLAEKIKDEVGVDVVVIEGHAGHTIVDYAAKNGVDCIVVASHRPGFQDYFLGSTAARVVRHAPCSVHVVR